MNEELSFYTDNYFITSFILSLALFCLQISYIDKSPVHRVGVHAKLLPHNAILARYNTIDVDAGEKYERRRGASSIFQNYNTVL